MCGTMAMMAFVSIVGSLSRQLGLAPWQAGMAVTVSGVLWMLMAPIWGRASDRLGQCSRGETEAEEQRHEADVAGQCPFEGGLGNL